MGYLVYSWLSLFSLGGSFVPWITPPKTGSEKWNARKLVFSTVCSFGAEVFITKTLPLGMWDPLAGTFPGGRGQFSDFFVIFNYLVPCPLHRNGLSEKPHLAFKLINRKMIVWFSIKIAAVFMTDMEERNGDSQRS